MMSLGWTRFCPEHSQKSSWRRQWKAMPTSFSNATMTERSRSCSTKLQPMPATRIGGNMLTKDRRFPSSHRIHSKPLRWKSTSLHWDSHQWSLQCHQDWSWVKRPKTIRYNPTFFRAKEYCSYHDSNGHQTVHCRSLWKYLEELVCQGFLKEYVLYPRGNLQCRTIKRSASYPTATHDHPVQGDWVVQSSNEDKKILPLITPFVFHLNFMYFILSLNKLHFAPNHFNSLCYWDYPLSKSRQVHRSTDGITPSEMTVNPTPLLEFFSLRV